MDQLSRTRNARLFSLTLAVLLIAIVLTVLAAPYLLSGHQRYEDLIVGAVAWQDRYKSGDYRLVALYLGAVSLGFACAAGLVSRGLSGKWGGLSRFELIFFWGLAGALGLDYYATHSWKPVWFETLLLLAVWAFPPMRERISGARPFLAKLRLPALAALYGYLSLSGVACALLFFFPGRGWNSHALLAGALAAAALIFLGVSVFSASSRLVYALQGLAPLLLLRCVQGSYLYQGSTLLKDVPGRTKLAFGVLALALCGWNLLSALRAKVGKTSSPTLATTVFAAAVGITYNVHPYFSPDLFHFGEIYIPWQQIHGFGQQLFSRFVSVQGLLGLGYGWVNHWIYGGTVSSFALATVFVSSFFAGIAAVLGGALLGNTAALLTIPFLWPVWTPWCRLFFCVPFVFLCLNARVLKRPRLWLYLYASGATFAVFFNPPTGIALTLSLVPLGLFQLGKLRQKHRLARGLLPLLILGGGALALFHGTFLGFLEFILENRSANDLAHGIPLAKALGLGQFQGLTLHAILKALAPLLDRCSAWVFGVPTALFLAVAALNAAGKQDRGRTRLTQVLALAAVIVIFCIVMVPYSFCRIDPLEPSRLGTASDLVICFFIPALACLAAELTGWRLATPVLALSLAYGFIGHAFTLQSLAANVSAPIAIPPNVRLYSDQDLGIRSSGGLFLDADYAAELRSNARILAAELRGTDSYYDLTDQSLYYLYLRKRVPVPYSADFITANEQMQDRTIRRLQANPPRLVWTNPNLRHDGGPASLRSYRVVRWLLEEGYVLERSGSLAWLASSDAVDPRFKDRNAADWNALMAPRDLERIPSAWGRNFDVLRWRFGAPKASRVERCSRIVLAANHGEGPRRDFLLLSLDPLLPPTPAEISWRSPGFGRTKILFTAASSRILIPLGAYPSWLLDQPPSSIDVSFPGGSPGACAVRAAAFYRLVH